MHRYLLGVNDDPDILIDHINGNTLDNRMCNLRICNQTENARNRRASRTNRLGILGISVMPNGRYKATIVADRIPHSLGTFDTLELAIQARHEAEIRYHGEFASHISRSKDDAQVSRLEVRKRYGEEPRVEVRLEEIKNEQQ